MRTLGNIHITVAPRPRYLFAATMTLAALSLIARPTLLAAQTAGNPIIYSTGVPAGTSASTPYIDAYVATSGSDICERINTAWGMVLGATPTGTTPPNVNSVTVDARGFTGSWSCESSPFTPTGTSLLPNGVLLLGNAIITTTTTWYVPSHTSLIGIGSGSTSVTATGTYGVNTVIRAAPSFRGPAVLQMGASLTKGGPWFGIVIKNLTVDCVGQSGCVGIYNNEAEENSMVDQVQIWDAPLYGLHVSAANASDTGHPGATNSGPYQNIYIAYTSNCSSCGGAVGLQVDGPGTQIGSGAPIARSIREFNDITVTGRGTGAPYLAGPAVAIYGVSTAFTNSHIEFAQTGLAIGVSSSSPCTQNSGNCVTDGVEVSNVSIGTLTNAAGQLAVSVGNSTSAAPATYDVTLTGIAIQSGNSKVTTLHDYTSGTILPSTIDPFIGLYALGRCSGGCNVVKNTQ